MKPKKWKEEPCLNELLELNEDKARLASSMSFLLLFKDWNMSLEGEDWWCFRVMRKGENLNAFWWSFFGVFAEKIELGEDGGCYGGWVVFVLKVCVSKVWGGVLVRVYL